MSNFTGKKYIKAANKVAEGIEERGEMDARLRNIRAEQLLGSIRDNTGKRGFRLASQTHADLEREAATLEGMDIDRIKFRTATEAYNVRMRGHSQAAQAIAQNVSQIMSGVQLGMSVYAMAKSTPTKVIDPLAGHDPFPMPYGDKNYGPVENQFGFEDDWLIS